MNERRKFRAVPRSYPLRSLVCFVHSLIRAAAEGLLDYQGRAGIISIVQWNLRPVIFGVDFVDERQITHLICARLKYDLYDFFQGVFFGPFIQEEERKQPQNTPKKVR